MEFGGRNPHPMFSTFSDGWPAVGLLVLRAAVGVAFFVQSSAYLTKWHEGAFFSCFIGLALLATGSSLLIGCLTPFASVLSGVIIVARYFCWIPTPRFDLFEPKLVAAFAIVITIAIVCLGPGAFSLDARLFGRREIVIPDASHPPKL